MIDIEGLIPLFVAGAVYFLALIAYNLKKPKAQ